MFKPNWPSKGLAFVLIFLLLTAVACIQSPVPLTEVEFEPTTVPTEIPSGAESPTSTPVTPVSTPISDTPAPIESTLEPPTTAAPIDTAINLPWETIGDRPVIDPKGRYWEKYESGTSLAGLYLRMDDINAFGDFLELKSDGTFDLEVGGNLTTGKWKEEGPTIILTPA